jgi:N6-adenosine-specific RNA methylase IME4
MKKDTAKATVDLLLATKAVVERDLELGLVTEKQLRYRLVADDRQKLAKELAAKGMSHRQIAKMTGESRQSIDRDLGGPHEPKDGPRGPRTKAEKRAVREAELAVKQIALPDKHYGVILADPEWRFEPYSRDTGMDRAADNHYPTSPTEIIAARDVPSIAADDCVLFLWATVPMLPAALEVMKAWGFEYRSHVMWDKIHIGTGYWFRNRHELLLVGTRGEIPAPAMGSQFPSVITISRTDHSKKPEQFIELIEQYFPSLPKIELNRRGPPRPGWDAWGNEADELAVAS